jgi:putative spermidine/putrescine transport system substrate-binding protein
MKRSLVLAALVAVGVTLSGCAGAPSGGSTATTQTVCREAKDATSCGGLAALAKDAKAEGVLLLPGDPSRNPALVKLAKQFTKTYKVEVKWVYGQTTTAQQLTTAATQSEQPDVFLLDPATSSMPKDRVAPYRVKNFYMLATANRDPNALWARTYAGVMTLGYDPKTFGDQASASSLLSSGKAHVGLPGSPATSIDTAAAVVMLDAMATAGSGEPGVATLRQLKSSGRLSGDQATPATVQAGRVNVYLDWNYNQRLLQAAMPGKAAAWQWVIPSTGEIVGYSGIAVNAKATHPAAARLWEEFMFSEYGQIALLKSGATPTLYQYFRQAGKFDAKDFAALAELTKPPHVATAAELGNARDAAISAWPQLRP